MATVWITYSWKDNKNQEVDYIVQELTRHGINVKLDNLTIQAGGHLWTQIENFITNPKECDALLFYATQHSLNSNPCKEEYVYALDRALCQQESTFPLIGLFPSTPDVAAFPASIRTRLCISTTDPNWIERIKAAVEKRDLNIIRSEIKPYFLKIHQATNITARNFTIEVRPRAGTWSPFIAAIPKEEETLVNLKISAGPKDRPMTGGMLVIYQIGYDQSSHYHSAQNEATPTQSYYLHCDVLPSSLLFGQDDSATIQYTVDPRRITSR